MLDAELAATDAGRLARFAERVRDADRPAAGSPADRVRRLFARAELVRAWPAVRSTLVAPVPTADATLAERSRQLAERCRGSKKGGLFGSSKESAELLNEAADRLTQLADRLDAAHTPTGVVAQLNGILAGWGTVDPTTTAFVKLDGLLAKLSDACTGLLNDLDATPLGHAFAAFDAKLTGWPPDDRATAGAIATIINRVAQRTSDPAVWEEVRRWVSGCYSGVAAVTFKEQELPTWTGVVERFPLAGDRRAYLVVAGQAEETAARDDGAPAVGSDGSQFDWPTASSRAADQPFDTILEVRPDGGVTLSDGPESPAVVAYHELFSATRDEPVWWAGERWRRARQLSRTPEPAAVATIAGRWIDECSPTDPQCELIRRWAEACGLTVVPAESADTPGVEVRSVFASAAPGTVVGGNRVGFRTDDAVWRPAIVEVSLGPLPVGFAELERAADSLPKKCQLRQLVSGLRTAAEGNYLREAVLGLYSEFWGDAGAAARDTAPDATAEVGERLNALLADAYGLQPFFPVNVHELPSGWITVAAGSRVMTGVVTRVVRPGLQDDRGNLRIPAVVEVD